MPSFTNQIDPILRRVLITQNAEPWELNTDSFHVSFVLGWAGVRLRVRGKGELNPKRNWAQSLVRREGSN